MVRCTAFLCLLFSAGLVHAQVHNPTPGVTLLQFSSPSCGPCRSMRPIVRLLREAGYSVREIDVNREPRFAEQYRVRSLPTFVTVVGNREEGRLLGATSQAQLQEMMHKSLELARQRIDQAVGTRQPKGEINLLDRHIDPAQPNQERLVGVSTGLAEGAAHSDLVREPARGLESLGAAKPQATWPPVAAPQSPAPARVSADQLIAASVRLTVEDRDGQSTGTGTVVDSREGASLVLTCGHIFRSSGGKGPISVTFFQPSPSGAVVKETLQGELVDFDLERDLALVSVWTKGQVTVAPIAPPTFQVAQGNAVTTVGCNEGANPTAINTQVTAINRYQGAPNVEAAGAPIEGRSGGGMFNSDGQLVGVCFAADHEGNEGLYAALGSIYAKLDELKLSAIYRNPQVGQAAAIAAEVPQPEQAASAPSQALAPQVTIRGQQPATTPSWPLQEAPAAPEKSLHAQATAAPLSPEEQAAYEEIQRLGAESEVVCIIRPKTPEGKSQVIRLENASAAFVSKLQEQSRR